MFIEICLAIITLTLLGSLIAIVKLSYDAKKSMELLEDQLYEFSLETLSLIKGINRFVQNDLHTTSQQATQLISKLNELSSDINDKSHSLSFLFKPLDFVSSKLDLESFNKKEAIPQIIKWIASSAILIKTTKEFIKNYGKRNQ